MAYIGDRYRLRGNGRAFLLAVALVTMSGLAHANGGFDTFARPDWLALYEIGVWLVEAVCIALLFCQPWKRALVASLLANAASLAAGAVASARFDYGNRELARFVNFAVVLPLFLPVNFLIETAIVMLVCRLRLSKPFAARMLGVNAATWMVGAVLFFPTVYGTGRSQVSMVMSDMRSMATGLEAYYTDHGRYPPAAPLESFAEPVWRAKLARKGGTGFGVPVGLTSPVAYLEDLPSDRFAPVEGLPIAYYADTNGWVLVSAGTDRRYDIVPERDYTSTIQQPSPALDTKRYDPTNGTRSPGDVLRVKQ